MGSSRPATLTVIVSAPRSGDSESSSVFLTWPLYLAVITSVRSLVSRVKYDALWATTGSPVAEYSFPSNLRSFVRFASGSVKARPPRDAFIDSRMGDLIVSVTLRQLPRSQSLLQHGGRRSPH